MQSRKFIREKPNRAEMEVITEINSVRHGINTFTCIEKYKINAQNKSRRYGIS